MLRTELTVVFLVAVLLKLEIISERITVLLKCSC